MVQSISLDNSIKFPELSYANIQQMQDNMDDKSIFDSSNVVEDANVESLNDALDNVKEKQGFFSNLWDGFKGAVGIGTSSKKCDDAIEKFKNGEISYDEALEEIQKFDNKQSNSLELFSNIATSVLSIATIAVVTVATGGIGLPAAIAIGAGVGAVTKAGFKFADRATNQVEGDAANVKNIAKDALNGAVTGGLASVTMGTAGGASSVGQAVKSCALTGVKSGAAAGAATYSIDCAFEEDQDFNFADFAKSTASGAVVGGTVGAVMGGANGALRAGGFLKSGCNLKSMTSGAQNATVKNVAANSACTSEYKILNDKIKSVA